MDVKLRKEVLKQMEEILEEYNELKATFSPIGFGYLGANQEEIAKSNGLITRAKALVFKHFGVESQYYTQMELHSQGGRQGKCGRNELNVVMADLSALYNNLKKNYESLKDSYTTLLKFDKIIEEINLTDKTYEEVITEINGTYINHYFASMYIMARKLMENLLYDCLKAFYKTQDVEKYYNTEKNRHQGYGILIDNFNDMINDTKFKTMVGDVDQKFIDLLKEFQETGNLNAHSLFNLAHQDFIEERKDKINYLIKKLDWVLQKL